jgi:hypothetical protein
VIVPEFPSLLALPILMIATLLAIIASRRKCSKHQTGPRQHPARIGAQNSTFLMSFRRAFSNQSKNGKSGFDDDHA